jgi:anaerobic magnesium-protoporphyrin IX monomethyl ester cyclase
MRVVLADLKGENGHVNKDTVAGGYGSRFRGRSKAMKIIAAIRRAYENLPSIHLAYIAAILSRAGHEVSITRGRLIPGDLAIILTSLVDFRHEVAWAKQFKQAFRSPVGFFGTPATHLPNLFLGDGDFVIRGEPEDAAQRIAGGETMKGIVMSKTVQNLDSLPFPRWDLAGRKGLNFANMSPWPTVSVFPLLASRSCPEFCTYCPHRITAEYRARSPENVLAELEYLHSNFGKVNIVFRDPLFTQERERSLTIAEGIIERRLPIHFECETRLDALDTNLIDLLYRAGLRTITFGVESVDPQTLKRVGRRPIPSDHQKKIISYCRSKGIATTGFYVFGFLSDTVSSIRATIDYSIELNSTNALFKILTPYPGTPLRKQMERLIFEQDLEKFDGYTPTFHHPNLTNEELLFALSSAFARFYFRPSWPLYYFRIDKYFRRWIESWDERAQRKHDRTETNRGFVSA